MFTYQVNPELKESLDLKEQMDVTENQVLREMKDQGDQMVTME